MDGWSAAQKAQKSNPAAYELAVTANLREVDRRQLVRGVEGVAPTVVCPDALSQLTFDHSHAGVPDLLSNKNSLPQHVKCM